MRPVSFLLSLCFHAGIIALVLFLPQGEPLVDLTAPVIDIGIYTIGSPGTSLTRMSPTPSPRTPQERPELPKPPQTLPQTPPEVPKPPQDTATPEPVPVKPEPAPVPPPPEPEPVPEKPEPAPIPIPQPDAPKPPEKTAPAEPKQPEKPVPEPPKSPEKPEPVPPKPPVQPKPSPPAKPSKPARSADDILREALGDLKEQTPDPDSTTEGSGPGGQGGDGIGIVGSYMQSLVSRIKPNWEAPPRIDRRNPTALVRISIAKDGTILEAAIVTPSGDAVFDGSVLKAVYDTIQVEPPPTPDLMQVQVPFAYEAIRR